MYKSCKIPALKQIICHFLYETTIYSWFWRCYKINSFLIPPVPWRWQINVALPVLTPTGNAGEAPVSGRTRGCACARSPEISAPRRGRLPRGGPRGRRFPWKPVNSAWNCNEKTRDFTYIPLWCRFCHDILQHQSHLLSPSSIPLFFTFSPIKTSA